MLNCRQVTRLFSQAQERQLTFAERVGLKMHVMMCKGCRNFGEHMTVLRKITRAYVQGENAPNIPKPDRSADDAPSQ